LLPKFLIILLSNLSILSVPDEGYFERTWWRLFQKHVVHTYLDIYVFITSILQNIFYKNPNIYDTNVCLFTGVQW